MGLEIAFEVGCALGPRQRDRERRILLEDALVEHPRNHRAEQQRTEQRAEQQRREDGAPVAQVLAELLGEHREERAHQESTPSIPRA